MELEYRELENGEPIYIGDQYLERGEWKTLNESMYREWAGTYSHYIQGVLYPMRRPLDAVDRNQRLTESVYADVTQGIFTSE